MIRFNCIKTPKNIATSMCLGFARIIVAQAKKLLVFLLALVFLFGTAMPLRASEGLWKRPTVTGSWGGARDTMSEKGIDFEFIYTGEVMTNLTGGIQKQTDYQSILDLTMAVDAEKLFSWKGASFFFYGMGTLGGSPSLNSGDAQGLSNMELNDAFKLAEAWYQQKLFNDKFSFLIGLYDVASEFDTSETGSLFFNSSFGTGPDLSQTGQNGPSLAPDTSLGIRLRLEPTPWLYWQTAVLDGVSGDPAHPFSTRINFAQSDGFLIINEMGLITNELKESWHSGKISLGGWYFTAGFDDLTDVDGTGAPLSRKTNLGFYMLGEYRAFSEKSDENQGLDVYGRFGWANPAMNQFNYSTQLGIVYTGAIPKRDEDQLGVGVTAAINGNKFKNAMIATGTPVESAEIAIEATYRAQITPWLAVQPDVQYIINPGTDPTLGNAVQTGLRFEMTF